MFFKMLFSLKLKTNKDKTQSIAKPLNVIFSNVQSRKLFNLKKLQIILKRVAKKYYDFMILCDRFYDLQVT